jgi:RHS repeat-associated protein
MLSEQAAAGCGESKHLAFPDNHRKFRCLPLPCHSEERRGSHRATRSQMVTLFNQVMAVHPGELVRFGGWVYRESGDGYAEWKLAAYDSNMTPVAYPGSFSPSTGSWQMQDETYTVPSSGVAYVRLYCEIYLATTSSVARFDDGFLSAGTTYYHGDQIGSARMISDAHGTAVWEGTFLPYGYEMNASSAENRFKFTGHERDGESGESGLDHTWFRQYASKTGRWMTPDPGGLAVVDPFNPQSWNRYAYVNNNPLNSVDPLGLYCLIGHCSDPAPPPPPPDPGWQPDPDPCITYGCGFPSPPGTEEPQPTAEDLAPPRLVRRTTTVANNGPPEQTKQQCIDDFLKTGYGPAGNFMAKTMVPSFSAISIFTNTRSWAKGEGATLLAKGALSAGPMAYGKILRITGTNMAAYPGTAAAGADIAETGAFWTTTGATAGEVLLFVGVEGSVFATTADLYARWTCRNVP